ncbi:universal stress protein [Nitratireductor soli]|uniref:universal stress protein n=1 Tax=Nitratireductor soli TaxID=1670619 RepID=UPI00065E7954|nr:universal stress protein [Nitratireductor soli]
MFKRILVPVDGSDNALKALKLGVEMQKMTGAELMMLTVFRHHSLLEASMSMVRPDDPQNLDDAMREHAREIADAAKKAALEMGAENPRGFVKNGPPARTIVKFGKEREVDLIVLGSRGLGDLEGYLLGSVSHKVTSLAECPVMVV